MNMNKETNRTYERGREDEEEEEKKIETFFKLIKNYQEARKRRRDELAENSGDVRKKSNSRERSGIVVPAFQPEDFSQYRTDLKMPMTVWDHKGESTKEKEEESDKEVKEDNDLDLTLAL